jgi:hypothetical protein
VSEIPSEDSESYDSESNRDNQADVKLDYISTNLMTEPNTMINDIRLEELTLNQIQDRQRLLIQS